MPPPAWRAKLTFDFVGEIRYALRRLARAPGFAAVAIATLALGIGANTAIFSIVHAVVLAPLPYRAAQRVVALVNSGPRGAGSITSSSLPDYEDWRRQATSFESLGLLSGWTFNLSGLELPERLYGARVSGSLFPLLGTPPLLGRVISPDDDRADRGEVAVLSYRLWRRLFAGDPGIIGRPLMLEGRPHVVVGVMPFGFRFPSDDTEIWAAIKDNMSGMPRDGRFMVAVARLKPGVALRSAQAEMDAISARLSGSYPSTNRGWRVPLLGIQDAVAGDAKPALFLLLGAAGFVLLIACANVSSLLLTRLTSRNRETGIRLALGASRAGVVAQVVTENLVIALLGGTAGVALALAAVRLVVAFGPADVPRLDTAGVDAPVLAFAFALSLAAGVAPALAPAFRSARAGLQASLREGFGGYATATGTRLGELLIVGEVALAVTVAIAGGLLLKSFAALTSVSPGFDTARVLSLKVFLTPPRYLTIDAEKRFIHDALLRTGEVPGVEAAAAVSQLPLGDPSSLERFEIDGRPLAPDESPAAAFRAVSASYFSVLRIPIARGHGFTAADRENTPFVVVVNGAMARRFWPDRDPIGQRIRWATEGRDRRWLTIVGVAGDVKSDGLGKSEPPAVYAPYTQRVFPWLRWTSFVVRTHGEPMQSALAIRRALLTIDANQPVYQILSLDQVVAQSVSEARFHTLLLDLFAALALTLAAVGVYGMIGYWVTQRMRDIGIRMALGATTRKIALMVVGRSAALSSAGVLLGLGLSLATMRGLSALLFHISPLDVPTFAQAALIATAAGVAAAYLPARRAARLDPLSIIRGE
ncbi:MAG TPA: ABC transporter permease [Thermoanaerobaculia bacterium]|nr:ABC transporter permease [Thermoanaerobaculia bacterium]